MTLADEWHPVPKAVPAVKPGKPLRRSKGVRRVGPKREAKWLAAYGSPARVAFVKRLPCAWCATTRAERRNCHLPTRSGMGMKGPYTAVVPMCDDCHAKLDGRARPRPTETELETFWHIASQVQADWLDYCKEAHR